VKIANKNKALELEGIRAPDLWVAVQLPDGENNILALEDASN
jgi:hypothetical protein